MRMKTIIATYPDFQHLPAGIKRMLVASEDFFFREAQSPAAKARTARTGQREAAERRIRREAEGSLSAFGPDWRN